MKSSWWCDTTVIRKRRELITVLDDIGADADNTNKPEASAKARAVKSKLESVDVQFSLVATHDTIVILEKLPRNLQSVNITAELAHHSMQLLKECLKGSDVATDERQLLQ